MRKQKEIEFLGKKMLISARSANDVFLIDSLNRRNGKSQNIQDFLLKHIIIIQDGLKINARNILSKIIFKIKYSHKKLIKKLSEREIYFYSKQILELENNDVNYLKYLLGEISQDELDKAKKKALTDLPQTDMKREQ